VAWIWVFGVRKEVDGRGNVGSCVGQLELARYGAGVVGLKEGNASTGSLVRQIEVGFLA
jgi:hypothetical protein